MKNRRSVAHSSLSYFAASIDPPPLKNLAEFAGRAALVGFFGVLATAKAMAILSMLRRTELNVLELASQVANLAFVLLVLCMAGIRLKPQRTSTGWESRLTALAGTFLPLLLLALPFTGASPAIRITGLIVIAIGWVLSAYVIVWLGRAFSVMPQARRLVMSGPYGVVRHPLYLSEEVAFLGLVLLNFSPAALAIAAVHWPFQLRRMVNEEKVLLATFPEYLNYSARIPRVIPRLFLTLQPRKA